MSGQYCVDANIFITAWYENYRDSVLPSLWEQLALHRDDIILLKPIFDEIEPISSADMKLSKGKKKEKYPLRMWMQEKQFAITSINNETEAISLDFEKQYEISNESKGANQKDIILIAYAKQMGKTVVTFEGEQPQKPGKKSNYRIPLICREQDVDCINFVTMLERLGIRI